eukprot:SM000041S15497  [mRNA]  locus=s41:434327:443553:- [translate_table: standard]
MQLARALAELAGAPDQKKAHVKLVRAVFPKLAVYSSVDPSLAQALLMLLQSSTNATTLRYCYYFLGRLLAESEPGIGLPGGGIPTPDSESLAEVAAHAGDGVADGVSPRGATSRARAVHAVLSRLAAEAASGDPAGHARRVAALKALAAAPTSNAEALAAISQIVLAILNGVSRSEAPKGRRGLFSRNAGDRELLPASLSLGTLVLSVPPLLMKSLPLASPSVSLLRAALRTNLHYAALSAMRRLPLDPTNETLLLRAAQGLTSADPIAIRHALAMAADMARTNPLGVAEAIDALPEVIFVTDVFARVYLARLCATLVHSIALNDALDWKGLFSAVLFQLLYDPSSAVVLEAVAGIVGSINAEGSTQQRATGWVALMTSSMEAGGSYASKARPPLSSSLSPPRPRGSTGSLEPILRITVQRLDQMLKDPSRPILHGVCRVVAELGKARAAASSLGVIDELGPEAGFYDQSSTTDQAEHGGPAGGWKLVQQLLGQLMEGVRTITACECVYVRSAALKALIWMQSVAENYDELRSIILGELHDPAWTPAVLNELLVTLHLRFKASPELVLMVLDIAGLFVDRVPAKIDTDILQQLWKMCLIGCGPEGKYLALETVSAIMELPPPPPLVRGSTKRASASDPRSAVALQRLMQAAVYFLGENANYAAAEYAWESATPPTAALMMLEGEKMITASAVRNPTLAQAVARLQRTTMHTAWEVRVLAVQALMTVAVRSGEPYRLQIYEFLHVLLHGENTKDRVQRLERGSTGGGEDEGASGTALQAVIGPMIRALDDMYQAQDTMLKEVRRHEFAKEDWKDEELKAIYDSHERLMDLVSLFCFVPRSKYLPLGPTSNALVSAYREIHGISAATPAAAADLAVAAGISDLLSGSQLAGHMVELGQQGDGAVAPDAPRAKDLWAGNLDGLDTVNDFLGGAGAADEDDIDSVGTPRDPDGGMVSQYDLWASSLLEASVDDDEKDYSSSDSSSGSVISVATSSYSSILAKSNVLASRWDEEIPQPQQQAQASDQQQKADYVVSQVTTSYISDAPETPTPAAGPVEELLGPGRALYDFTSGGDDELSVSAGDELMIEYEVDGWYHVRRSRDRAAGLVPMTYVELN